MKKSSLIYLVLALIFSLRLSAAELNIEITRGVDNPIPVAVVPFAWDGANLLEEDIAQIISSNLEQVGEFRALSRTNMLSLPSEERDQ